ncbi:MAG: hypothetical protein ACI83B_002662 [Sediminicola sp.]|jgi:hypothetical protein
MLRLPKLLLCVIMMLLMYSCSRDEDNEIIIEQELMSPDQYSSEVVVSWFNLVKVLTTETEGYTPPVAARAFGYTGIALYESVQVGAANKLTLSGKLNKLNLENNFVEGLEYHWPTVANTAIASMTKYFYSNATLTNYTRILELESEFNNEFSNQVDEDVIDRSITLAKDLTDQIILWSSTDGGFSAQFKNFPVEYEPLPGVQFWKPTAPDQRALQPYWGNNRPFITLNVENSIPVDPPAYSTDVNSIYYIRALEVYNVVNNITLEQTIIAEFWADDPKTSATPPGHSISILNQLVDDNELDLLASSEAFAKLAIGVNDAFISCWKVKYTTNYPRPVTVINNQIDASWVTILSTPPFPEYTSGHSVQSGALARILTSLFGENKTFIDRTHQNRTDIDGTPRVYSSFYDMAEEAAASRLYGGIHFKEAIELGLEQGYQIGQNVINFFDN